MKNSKIEWTDHTFNPWRGCTKVSPGCKNCYAESLAKRFPETLGEWGDDGTRIIASEAQWKEPLKWNRAAELSGKRARVFCASMADVFEDRPELVEPRARFFSLIFDTPHLEWLILTKRPENIMRLHPFPKLRDAYNWNIMWGTSVENQEQADVRIPELLKIPGRRFLSCEPLLGPVDLTKIYNPGGMMAFGRFNCLNFGINWVIVGGESGPKARPMHPDWVRAIRDQCQTTGVPFFFKQWGEYRPSSVEIYQDKQVSSPGTFSHWTIQSSTNRKEVGKPSVHAELSNGKFVAMERVGMEKAGNVLDGEVIQEFPDA
jgi:protein gp37